MRDITLGLKYVVVLYPSIDQTVAAKVVMEEIVDNNTKYCGIDEKVAGVYLAVVIDRDRQVKEGIYHLLPRRKSRSRRHHTIYSRIGREWWKRKKVTMLRLDGI